MSYPGYSYKFGDDNPWPTLDPKERWSAIFYPAERILSLNYAVEVVARKMHKEAKSLDQPIRLHFSGGDDSRVMVDTFCKLDIPFQLNTRQHMVRGRCINQDDVDAAQSYARSLGMETDLQIIDDIDLVWGRTDHKFFIDMTALSARLGWARYPLEYNVWATTPYISGGGRSNDWELLTTFSLNPTFLHSFFMYDPEIMRAQLAHDVMKITRRSKGVLAEVAANLKTAKHWSHLADVFAYEQIAKPIIMRYEFPQLEVRGRRKNTGFDDSPIDMNTTATPQNEEFMRLLRQKGFRIPVYELLDVLDGDVPMRYWKEDGAVLKEKV
jgi:hypothetical protein